MTEASIVAEAAARGSTAAPARLVALAAVGALALVALQAFAASRLELTFDEAYYTLWSRAPRVRLSRPSADGRPVHPRLDHAVRRVRSSASARSRWPRRRAAGADRLDRLAAVPVRSRGAALAVLMWIAAPLVIAGAVFVTPDAPLVLFWTLGLAALVELWRTGKARWLLAMGVALGLMCLSKFTAAFFAAGAGLASVATPSLRRWLRSPSPWLGLALAAAIFSPFVVWNAEHGWATFLKQGGRAASGVSSRITSPNSSPRRSCSSIRSSSPPSRPRSRAFPGGSRSRPGSPDEARRLLVSTIAPAARLLPRPFAPRPGPGQLARAALSRLRHPRRRLGAARPPAPDGLARSPRAALWAAPSPSP